MISKKQNIVGGLLHYLIVNISIIASLSRGTEGNIKKKKGWRLLEKFRKEFLAHKLVLQASILPTLQFTCKHGNSWPLRVAGKRNMVQDFLHKLFMSQHFLSFLGCSRKLTVFKISKADKGGQCQYKGIPHSFGALVCTSKSSLFTLLSTMGQAPGRPPE